VRGAADGVHMELVQGGADRVRQSEVIAALSHALDMTEGHPVGQAERTCLIGMRLAHELQLAAEDRYALYYALLLKDVGCSSSAARMCELFGTDDIALKTHGKLVDWTKPVQVARYASQHVPPGGRIARAQRTLSVLRSLVAEGKAIVETRCDRGAAIVRSLGFPDASADAVWALDEYWDGRGQPTGMAGEDIPLLARIACLSQTAEVFFATHGLAAAQEMVRERSGRWFDPKVAEAFLAIGPGDPLWADLVSDDVAGLVLQLESADRVLVLDAAGIDHICEAFADVIDAKSPFTARHSRGVATYAGLIGSTLGFTDEDLRELHRAGMLHDIGKLGIPNTILDKPAKLTDDEFARMRLHPAYTETILAGIPAFAGFAAVAAAHHERLDGRGYHRGVPAGDLPVSARALAVADVFEALTADRPYRGPMDPDEALAICRRDAGQHLDPACVDALAAGIGRARERYAA
jgi:HD-GYP domain-containing protein (c-di-GMP phosphodiesterase class II)